MPAARSLPAATVSARSTAIVVEATVISVSVAGKAIEVEAAVMANARSTAIAVGAIVTSVTAGGEVIGEGAAATANALSIVTAAETTATSVNAAERSKSFLDEDSVRPN